MLPKLEGELTRKHSTKPFPQPDAPHSTASIKKGLKMAQKTTQKLSYSFLCHRISSLALIGVVEPLYQLDARGLAAARGSHQRHRLADVDVEVEPVENLDLLPRRIVEGHVPEGYLPQERLRLQTLVPAAVYRRLSVQVWSKRWTLGCVNSLPRPEEARVAIP